MVSGWLFHPEVEDAAVADWFSDGLPELAFGFALASIGAVGCARVYFPIQWVRAALVLPAIAFVALMIWDKQIIGALKKSFLHRRTHFKTASTSYGDTSWFRLGTVFSLFLVPTFIDLFADRWGLALGMPVMAVLVYAQRKWFERPYSWWSAALLGWQGYRFPFCPYR